MDESAGLAEVYSVLNTAIDIHNPIARRAGLYREKLDLFFSKYMKNYEFHLYSEWARCLSKDGTDEPLVRGELQR